MHNAGGELRRILLPRTRVNKGKRKAEALQLRPGYGEQARFLTAVTAALVAGQAAALADALILHSLSPPSVTASRHPQKLTSSQ
jgi:hypothetical protein